MLQVQVVLCIVLCVAAQAWRLTSLRPSTLLSKPFASVGGKFSSQLHMSSAEAFRDDLRNVAIIGK